jgi:hypothetical protein
MEDFTGKKLVVGDKVVMIAPNYRHLVEGTILRFTPKMVVVEYFNDWNHSTPYRKEIKQVSYQLSKV